VARHAFTIQAMSELGIESLGALAHDAAAGARLLLLTKEASGACWAGTWRPRDSRILIGGFKRAGGNEGGS
jgi:hypothetical protein